MDLLLPYQEGSPVASLVKFRPVVWKKTGDRQMGICRTDGWLPDGNISLAHPYHEGKSCNKFG